MNDISNIDVHCILYIFLCIICSVWHEYSSSINSESFKISVVIEKNWGTYEDFYTMHL